MAAVAIPEMYQTLNGGEVPIPRGGELQLVHVLQRYRDVWVPTTVYPYLAIDPEKVKAYVARLVEFPVLHSSAVLVQNMSAQEAGSRILASFVSSSLTAGFGPRSNVIVEGRANAKANTLLTFNDPRLIGVHPYCARGTRYIYVGKDHRFQRTIGELIVVNARSRPKSSIVDFDRLNELTEELFARYYTSPTRSDLPDNADLSDLLDQIFAENEKVLSAAEAHHNSLAHDLSGHDYEAPILTKYGRLTHDASGKPRVEVSFALLHYETALREFDALKQATLKNEHDAAFSHGVSCVVAVAACMEAIANKLVFVATGAHPTYRDRRQPLQKVNDSCSAIAHRSQGAFTALGAGQAPFDALERVRILRNDFMHAKEQEVDVEPVGQRSLHMAETDEASCREYLKYLREGVSQIYSQLPGVSSPIETRTNVKWLGDKEVP